MHALLASVLAFLVAATLVLLDRTATLRAVVDATPPWRQATDARVEAIVQRLGALEGQAAEVDVRATRLESALQSLQRPEGVDHGR